MQPEANEDYIAWKGSCVITGKMEKQVGKICKKFNLTIVGWEGNNDREVIRCYFTPAIPEEKADEFYEFVEVMK